MPVVFLAHLSTRCLWWAIVVSVRLSSVVQFSSTFDVYTLETTFVIRFLWNLVRMFVLTISRPSWNTRMFLLEISRPSSNMGHVGSNTRSPGQILGNSCLHSRGHISKPDFDETWSECLFWQYLGQVRIWVMSGQKYVTRLKLRKLFK